MANAEQKEENREEAEETVEEIQQEPKTLTITDIELNELKNELEDYRDKYFRQLAETENLRKRLLKEKDELIKYAVRNLICDFLHPIDNMENALSFTEQASDEVKHWAHGFKMILTQYKDVLADHGVHAFESEGKQFDPHLHEAVDTVVTEDHQPGIIVEEILRGYKMGDKIVRPARVTVAKSGSDQEIEGVAEEKESNQEK